MPKVLRLFSRTDKKIECPGRGPLAPETKLSHLSAHMVNRLLRENRKSIPKMFNGRKHLKNVTLQI